MGFDKRLHTRVDWIGLILLTMVFMIAGCTFSPLREGQQSPVPSPSMLASPSPLRPPATLTPAATLTPQSIEVRLYSMDAIPITPTIEGSLWVHGSITHLALGKEFLFVPSSDGRTIERVSLNGKGGATDLVSSYFETGTLDSFNLIWRRPWLVFLDADFKASPLQWVIRAYNPETDEAWDVLEIQDQLSWPGPEYDFDGQNIVVAYNAYDAAKQCQASYLWVFNVQERRGVQVDAHCAEYGPFIWGPVAIHEDVLIAEQDLPQNEGSINRIVFFRREAQKWRMYHREDEGYNSMPVLSWPWLVWKAGERYAYGRQNKAYNFATGQRLTIRVPQGERASDPQVCGPWVIWNFVEHSSSKSGIDGEAYFYRLPAGPFLKYAKTTKLGGSFGRFACNEDGRIAWSYPMGPENTLVEWGRINDKTP